MLVAMALTGGMAACGGEDDTSSALTVDKREFLRRGNAICERQKRGLKEEMASYERLHVGERPGSYASPIHFFFLPAIEVEISQLRELDAPPGEERRIERMLSMQQRALDNVAAHWRIRSVELAERRFAKPGRLLRAYGLSSCARGIRG